MRLACLLLIAAATSCTQHADGECLWTPGSDGTCGGGDSGGGGTAAESPDYIEYPSATAVAIGDATYVLVAERDTRVGNSIRFGAMRPGGLPAELTAWPIEVGSPEDIRSWGAGDRGLVEVVDSVDSRAIEIDAAANPTSTTIVEPFEDAAFDGSRWLLVTTTTNPAELAITTLAGDRHVVVTLAPTDRLVDATLVAGDPGEALLVWRHRHDGEITVSATRIVDGVPGTPVDVATTADSFAYRLVVVPDRRYLLWMQNALDGELVSLDPVTLAATSVTTQLPMPHALVALREGYLGYDDYNLVRLDAALTENQIVNRLPTYDTALALAPNGADFVVVARSEKSDGGIDAIFSHGEVTEEALLAENSTYSSGCNVGGPAGALVGLVALAGLRRRRRPHTADRYQGR